MVWKVYAAFMSRVIGSAIDEKLEIKRKLCLPCFDLAMSNVVCPEASANWSSINQAWIKKSKENIFFKYSRLNGPSWSVNFFTGLSFQC